MSWSRSCAGSKSGSLCGVALDSHTKIIPVIRLGARKSADAHLFVHEVWQRLAPGAPPVFTTDGLWLYYYALTAHFGHWLPSVGRRHPVWQVDPRLLYGQLHKVKAAYKLKSLFTLAVCGTRDQLRNALTALGLTGRIMTAYVERVNLTLREHIPPLARRTWSLARTEQSLRIHLEWGRALLSLLSLSRGLTPPHCAAPPLSLSNPCDGGRFGSAALACQGLSPDALAALPETRN